MPQEKNKIVVVFDNLESYEEHYKPHYFANGYQISKQLGLFVYTDKFKTVDITRVISLEDLANLKCVYFIEIENIDENYSDVFDALLNIYDLYFLFHEGSVSDLRLKPQIEKFMKNNSKPLVCLSQHHIYNSIYGDDLYKISEKIRMKQPFDDEFLALLKKFPSVELEARLEFLHNLLTPEGIADYLVTSLGNEDRLSNVRNLNVNNETLLNLLKELKIVAYKGCFSKEYVEALRKIRDFVLN